MTKAQEKKILREMLLMLLNWLVNTVYNNIEISVLWECITGLQEKVNHIKSEPQEL